MTQESQAKRAHIEYQVYLPGSPGSDNPPFSLRIGEENLQLLQLYNNHLVTTAMFITAHNPGGFLSDPVGNMHRQSQLFGDLSDHGLTWIDGAGVAQTKDWPEEPSALVLGLDLETAYRLAYKYGQKTFVFAAEAGVPELYLTELSPFDLKPAKRIAERANRFVQEAPKPPTEPELAALAAQFGLEMSEHLLEYSRQLMKLKPAANDQVLAAVFQSSWNKVAECVTALYQDKPDDFPLSLGHWAPSSVYPAPIKDFSAAISFTVGDARAEYDRRAVRRK